MFKNKALVKFDTLEIILLYSKYFAIHNNCKSSQDFTSMLKGIPSISPAVKNIKLIGEAVDNSVY